jgi:cell wall-associated NlpC family hydrolase
VVKVSYVAGENRVGWASRLRQFPPGCLILIAVVLILSPAASASPAANSHPAARASGAPSPGTKGEVNALEAQIAQEQQQVAVLSEQFDRSTVHLAQVQAQLRLIKARLAFDKAGNRLAHRQLQRDAVNAYIHDEPATHLSSVFSSSGASALHDEYEETAIGNVDAAVDAVRSSERTLTLIQRSLRNELKKAVADSSGVHASELSAQRASAAAEATLATVKGHLAQLIAQQAAQQAAHLAATAARAGDRTARHRAAQQAVQDAQVAQTIAGGSAAAMAATNSANQATGGVMVGTGRPVKAHGAGAIALAEAEDYLGVPYVYGGASTRGLDCSGLTMLAWQVAGSSLLHSAAMQHRQSTPVPLNQVQPGDLLFYDFGGRGIDHVAMYVGSGPYGAGTVIQAAHTGTVVEFDPIWTFGLVAAGRP